MKWGPYGTAFGHMLLWMLGILFLIHLITWAGPEQDGSPTVPGWAELVVWALFIVPIVPAMIAGVPRLHRRKVGKAILFGVIFGVLTPLFGIAGLIVTLLMIGGNVELGPHDERISALLILSSLFFAAIVLGVGTALMRRNALEKY
jgi:hypothetical protein